MRSYFKLFLISLFLFPMMKGKAQAPEFSGFARHYSGVLTEPPNDFAILQNTLALKMEKRLGDVELFAEPFVYHYPGEDYQFKFRELYVDLYTPNIDLRVGKQQIVWGRSDGIFITDIVTPKDFSEFLLRPLDEIRKGVTSVKGTGYWKDHSLQLVWIPSFIPNTYGESGSIWYPDPQFPERATLDKSEKDIPLTLKNGEYFAKYSLKKSALDLDLMGGYTWTDDPVLHRTRSMGPIPGQPRITISPQHHRSSFAGMGFSTELLGVVLRGEGAWYFDKPFNSKSPTATEGIVEEDFLNYVVGLEKFVGEWKFSGQFVQEYIPEYQEVMRAEEMNNLATLMISRSLFREKLRIEWFTYYGITHEDALSRLRLFYDLRDGLTVEAGTNLFFGDEGRFGRFDQNDMVYARFRFDF